MGPEPPPKLERGPAWLRKIVNAIRDYCVANRIESVTLEREPNPTTPLKSTIQVTPKGTHLTLRVGGGAGAGGTPETYYVVINGVLYTQGFLVSGAPEEV